MKHWQKPQYSEAIDHGARLTVARAVGAEARAGTQHLIPGTNEPRPRVLQWSDYPDYLLVTTDTARFIIRDEDEDGLIRLVSMMRTEFAGGVVGSC